MKLIVRTIPVAEAVKEMRAAGIHVTEDKVRHGIEQGIYPWGDCIRMQSPEYTVYYKLFSQWLRERGEIQETAP